MRDHLSPGSLRRLPVLLSLFAAVGAAQTKTGTLTIQADEPTATVSPRLYGLMTEEINHSWDGGLYAELVQDRTVVDGPNALAHWTSVSGAQISVDDATGPSTAVPRSIRVQATAATPSSPAGVQNDGYWGIPVRPHTTYSGSLYAKTQGGPVPLIVRLVNDQTGKVAASAPLTVQSDNWQQYTFSLRTNEVEVSANNHLQLLMSNPSVVWMNVVSLFPPTYHNRPHGDRIDLMDELAAMHPKFLRLPGGNYLEGRHVSERFDWKKTIGPWVDRPTHPGPWRYQSSDGMGLLELLEWCEDLKIEPVLAVYAGYSLRHEVIPVGPQLDPYIQDALDEIEYVTGSTSTKWGAERAKDGHPAPFALQFVEVGNEDGRDPSGSYQERFPPFEAAIHKRYPKLTIIATTPVKGKAVEVLDRHFYMKPAVAFAQATHFDHMERNGQKIFVGEWATREGAPTPNLLAALGDAAFMTGLERNSDLVIMSCYAPLFVNVNPDAAQWVPDLIGFNALTSYGSPSYWAQVIFGQNVGTQVVRTTTADAGPLLFSSVTKDSAQHKLFVKVVNADAAPAVLHIAIKGKQRVGRQATLVSLSGDKPEATNTIDQPTAIVPIRRTLQIAGPSFDQSFAPYSINVLTLTY